MHDQLSLMVWVVFCCLASTHNLEGVIKVKLILNVLLPEVTVVLKAMLVLDLAIIVVLVAWS